MSDNKHISKIDLRRTSKDSCECPFTKVHSVRCAWEHYTSQEEDTQYVCECDPKCFAPQSRGTKNE